MSIFVLILAMTGFHFFTPYWWWALALPFVYGLLMAKSGWRAFLTGLLAAGLVWGGACLYAARSGGELILGRINTLLQFPADAYEVLLATIIIGMLCGAFGALTGFLLRDLFRQAEKA